MCCDECERFIDTDYFPMEVQETKYGDIYLCDSCAEKHLEEQEALEHKAGVHQQQQESL